MNRQRKYGQFFTPDSMCSWVLEKIDSIKKIGGNVLEPSFGKGDFLKSILEYKTDNLVGVEIDEEHFQNFDSTGHSNLMTFNEDFLYFDSQLTYDFIIGNPPYIELCYSFYSKEEQKEVKKAWSSISNGRINLVHIFLKKSFDLLNDDGIIAFLLPSSILTSPIYKKIRLEIFNNYTIEFLKEDVDFPDVAINVSLIILRKINGHKKYFFVNEDNYFIMENWDNFSKTKTIKDFGFKVSIGEVVWNQNKKLLTSDTNHNLLVYSSNIIKDGLDLSPSRGRLGHIQMNTIRHKNCIIFPRTVSKSLKFHFVKGNQNMIFENHVLVLTNPDEELLEKFYQKLVQGNYDILLKSFFNSSNLTKSELLSLPFN